MVERNNILTKPTQDGEKNLITKFHYGNTFSGFLYKTKIDTEKNQRGEMNQHKIKKLMLHVLKI